MKTAEMIARLESAATTLAKDECDFLLANKTASAQQAGDALTDVNLVIGALKERNEDPLRPAEPGEVRYALWGGAQVAIRGEHLEVPSENADPTRYALTEIVWAQSFPLPESIWGVAIFTSRSWDGASPGLTFADSASASAFVLELMRRSSPRARAEGEV